MDPETTAANTATSSSLLQGLLDPTNQEAWRQVVERYRPLIVKSGVRAGLRPEDAEDAAQETVAGFANSYREGRYDREKSRLGTWLFAIARNQVLRVREPVRNSEIRREVPGAGTVPLDRLEAPDPSEDLWDRAWRSAVLRHCVEQVRREVRPLTIRAFEEAALAGRPADEVARDLGITVNAVRLAKSRVLARIRDILPLIEGIF